MTFKSLIAATCTCLTMVSFNTNAALIERLGGLAYYDDVADLTWLADANLAGGQVSWDAANALVAGLNIAGITGWRMPEVVDVGNDGITYGGNIYQGVDAGYNFTTHSEISNMFYNVLGNIADFDIAGIAQDGGAYNQGPFTNFKNSSYWTGTEYAPSAANQAWYFQTSTGFQSQDGKANTLFVWAVQSGDVSAVPVPAAVWLFSSGLLGLIGVARRNKVCVE